MIWILALLAGLMLFASHVRRAAARARAEEGAAALVRGARSEAMAKPHLSVRIKLAGEGMATRDELHARHALEDEIERRGIGSIADAGSGGGYMDLLVTADDPTRATGAIRSLLADAGMLEKATIEEKR